MELYPKYFCSKYSTSLSGLYGFSERFLCELLRSVRQSPPVDPLIEPGFYGGEISLSDFSSREISLRILYHTIPAIMLPKEYVGKYPILPEPQCTS